MTETQEKIHQTVSDFLTIGVYNGDAQQGKAIATLLLQSLKQADFIVVPVAMIDNVKNLISLRERQGQLMTQLCDYYMLNPKGRV